jgi:hypothetical protein
MSIFIPIPFESVRHMESAGITIHSFEFRAYFEQPRDDNNDSSDDVNDIRAITIDTPSYIESFVTSRYRVSYGGRFPRFEEIDGDTQQDTFFGDGIRFLETDLDEGDTYDYDGTTLSGTITVYAIDPFYPV